MFWSIDWAKRINRFENIYAAPTQTSFDWIFQLVTSTNQINLIWWICGAHFVYRHNSDWLLRYWAKNENNFDLEADFHSLNTRSFWNSLWGQRSNCYQLVVIFFFPLNYRKGALRAFLALARACDKIYSTKEFTHTIRHRRPFILC